eukprot:1156355-Pelagomonas_calceolata.AAC.11
MQLSYNQSSRSQRHQHQQWHQQQQQQLVAPFLGGDPHIPLAPGASSMVLNLEGFEVCERLLLLLPFVTIALLCKFGCDCHAHYRQCEHKGKVANAIGKASTAFVTAEASRVRKVENFPLLISMTGKLLNSCHHCVVGGKQAKYECCGKGQNYAGSETLPTSIRKRGCLGSRHRASP